MVAPYTWQAPVLDFVVGEYETEVANKIEFAQEQLAKIRGVS